MRYYVPLRRPFKAKQKQTKPFSGGIFPKRKHGWNSLKKTQNSVIFNNRGGVKNLSISSHSQYFIRREDSNIQHFYSNNVDSQIIVWKNLSESKMDLDYLK